MKTDDSPVTDYLHAWSHGDPRALEDLMGLVYAELREMSRRVLRREHNVQTLNPTALVHEVYLRLAALKKVSWEDRRPFFAFASRLMRHVVVEHARALQRMKRGGELRERLEVEFDELPQVSGQQQKSVDVLDLEAILTELQERDPLLTKIIELRFFSGLTETETADVLGVSRTRVQREWGAGRRLLAQRLGGTKDD